MDDFEDSLEGRRQVVETYVVKHGFAFPLTRRREVYVTSLSEGLLYSAQHFTWYSQIYISKAI